MLAFHNKVREEKGVSFLGSNLTPKLISLSSTRFLKALADILKLICFAARSKIISDMHVGVQCIGHVSHVSPILRVSVAVIEIKIKEQHFIFAVQLVSPRVVKKNVMLLGLE